MFGTAHTDCWRMYQYVVYRKYQQEPSQTSRLREKHGSEVGPVSKPNMELLCSKNLKVSTRLVGAFGLLVVLLLAIGGHRAIRAVALEPTR
jgi:hypothetical protein